MKQLLLEIIRHKRAEIAHLKAHKRFSDFTDSPLFHRPTLSLAQSISNKEFGIIAEFKRKSPSAGLIAPDIQPAEQALNYQQQGAAGISVLTDNHFFSGSTADLITIRNTVQLPILQKEFILDEIQLFEAKAAGADAVLLIASILEKTLAHQLTIVAKSLGLEVLFELHTHTELQQLNDEVDLIAVNNRNLDAQQTSLQHSFDLIPYIPRTVPIISASGIQQRHETDALKAAGFAGALVGESALKNNHLHTLTSPFVL